MRRFFIFFLMLALSYAANAGTKFYGYAQITAESGHGVNGDSAANNGAGTSGLRFGAGAVRLGAKYDEGNTFGRLELQFDQMKDSNTTDFDRVFFAYVGHKFNYGFLNKITVGKFKNPIGMELNQAPNDLHIAKYDVLKKLQGGLVLGTMFSGDLGFGLSYDLAMFNSQDDNDNVTGEAFGYAAKLAYDLNDFHFQVGYTMDNDKNDDTTGTAAPNKKNTTLDVAFTYRMNAFFVAGEYVAYKHENEGTTTTEDKENAFHIHLAYKVSKKIEAVTRYVSYTQEPNASKKLTLDNIWLGANFYIANNERIQLNYVLASGDKRWETPAMSAQEGLYDANAFLAQYQINF